MERRFTPTQAPIRIEERADGVKTIIGYGAVFYREGEVGTEYTPVPDFRERISREAFNAAMDRPDDVRGLVNHDPNMLLGRTGAKTMRLSVDDTGLRYEIDCPNTQIGRDVAESIRRGDLSGSSFSFTVQRQAWIDEGDDMIREIQDVTLYDAGPVTFPAYEATTTDLRACGFEQANQSRKDAEAARAASRMRRIAHVECGAIEDLLTSGI